MSQHRPKYTINIGKKVQQHSIKYTQMALNLEKPSSNAN